MQTASHVCAIALQSSVLNFLNMCILHRNIGINATNLQVTSCLSIFLSYNIIYLQTLHRAGVFSSVINIFWLEMIYAYALEANHVVYS